MVTSLQALKTLGANKIILGAVEILRTNGLAKGVTHERISGKLSCSGAVYAACGADQKKIPIVANGPIDAGVPQKNQVLASEIILYLESFTGTDDLEEWNDHANVDLCINALQNAATRLMILTTT